MTRVSKREKKAKYTTVSIPVALHNRIKGLIEGKGFKSVSDYVTFVLREIVSAHESEQIAAPFDAADLERIKRRLKALGYL
ncbi:MAG: ribbon-helix-helix domain-containing protein [Thaumarchaeota archaeon]|nr:ribbon-helix-helix domain-containing protein [Nitrososphaerota archaeon]MCL5318588.1 ribbon-helix-helix domain-containing protein [Nitrososphaerota archaeon]